MDAGDEAPQLLPAATLDFESASHAVAAAGAALYRWTIADDKLVWSSNAGQVLGCDPALLPTGRKFAEFLDGENITSRYDTVMHSNQRDETGNGIAFEIEYCFRPDGRQKPAALWLEDIGRWFGPDDGRPQVVYGQVRAVDQRHARDQEMNFLSGCDALTGMMNRTRMLEALDEAIANAKAEKTQAAFIILAVKNLDIMNEAYGFEVADEVIVAMAQRLRRVMRMGDAIARYSGSRFGIILNACKPAELLPALERFMHTVRDSVIETKLGPVWALLSIGAVSLPALGDSAAEATARAEEALSKAMRLPTDGHIIYTSSREREAQRMLNARCATEIVNCLRDGLFRLAYQPVRDMHDGGIAFHEALLRMQDSTGTMITAGHLVPIAEHLGLIRLIDRAVVQMALNALAEYPQARLSVNLSATTVNDPRWHAQILEMISDAADLAPRLIIEVTETAALGDIATSRAFLVGLRNLGCGIAIDDFGAGYTSYRNLKELPLTMIKLDGMYCRNLDAGGGNSVYVHSMVELAHAFGLTVVAEWVENNEDAQKLRALGVDMMQGNCIGEPDIAAPWTDGSNTNLQKSDSGNLAISPTQVEAPDATEVPEDPVATEAEVNLPLASSLETDLPAADGETMDDNLALLRQALKDLQDAVGTATATQDADLARAS
jgi:diguanylate cyclase (GGDEF)-like protein